LRIPDLQLWHRLPGATPSMFYSVDGGRSRSLAPAPPRGPVIDVLQHLWRALLDLQLRHLPGSPPSMFYSIDSGRSGTSSSDTSQGAHHQHFCIDGGRSRTSGTASQGAHHRRFTTLMVTAPEPLALPPRGPPSTFYSVDGGHSRTLRQHPPRSPPSTFLRIDGGRSRILRHHPLGDPPATSSTEKTEKMRREKDMLAPPASSRPLLRWVRGPLSEPCRPGTPAYKL
jgi:hypothetical protein